VTDPVKSEDVTIKYCPPNDMVADFFTKPVQGSLFQKLWNAIMNIEPETVNCWDHRSVLEQEAKLVAVYNALPQVVWTRNFLRAQGYHVQESLVEQDNKSTILLAEGPNEQILILS
jgi:hypothetical protein